MVELVTATETEKEKAMAHFYAAIKGGRGEATRLGHKTSGITATVASYGGAIHVHMYWNEALQRDEVHITAGKWNNGRVLNEERTIWSGSLEDYMTAARAYPKHKDAA